jgi:hypothetical protein
MYDLQRRTRMHERQCADIQEQNLSIRSKSVKKLADELHGFSLYGILSLVVGVLAHGILKALIMRPERAG